MMNNWIPVTKRLPEENCAVLMTILDDVDCYVEAGRYAVSPSYEVVNGEKRASYAPVNSYDFTGPGFYICMDDDTYVLVEDVYDVVTAWIPIPGPYKAS